MEDNTTIIREKCEIIEKIIISIYDHYKLSTIHQQNLIETTIGASLFYISSKKAYWTGKISIKAKNDKSEKLTKDHQYPRKIAARELLNMAEALKNKETSVFELFEEKYAKFNYITTSENQKLKNFQKDKNFIDVDSSYKNAGVELVEITEIELKKYSKGRYV